MRRKGSRRITFFPDPPRRARDVYVPHRGRCARAAPILLANGNPGEHGKLHRWPAFCRLARSASEALPTCSRWSAATSVTSPRRSSTVSGRKVDLNDLCRARQGSTRGVGHGFAEALHAVGRAALRPRVRPRRVQHRRRVRLQHGRDGEQGPQHLQRPAASWPRPRPRRTATSPIIESVVAHEYFHNWTGNRITCRDWFQLCLKEGPHGLPRPGVLGRRAVARPCSASSTWGSFAPHQFPEDAGPLAHPVRPDSYIEINNFYTATVYEKGAELVRMIETILGHEDFRKGMDLYFDRHDGAGGHVRGFPHMLRGRLEARPRTSSSSGTHKPARRSWSPPSPTTKPRSQAELKIEQVAAADAGRSQARSRCTSRSSIGLIGGNGHEIAAQARRRRDATERRAARDEARADVPLHGRSFAAGAVAPARLLGAGKPHASISRDRDLEFLMAHDQRSVQPLAGGQHLCDAHAGRHGQGPTQGRARHAARDRLREGAR